MIRVDKTLTVFKERVTHLTIINTERNSSNIIGGDDIVNAFFKLEIIIKIYLRNLSFRMPCFILNKYIII